MKVASATLSCLILAILAGCSISAFEEDTGPVPPDTHGLFWGTGVFVSDTIILTARHVVSDCSEVRVASATGGLRGAHADVLATGFVDMALIQIAQPAVPIAHARFRSLWPTDAQMATLTTKDSSWLFDDEGPLIGYGYPTQSRSLTPLLEHLDGLAASRPETAHGYHPYVILGHIAHGDSGGPIVDQNGYVVGMMTNGVDFPRLLAERPDLKNSPELKNGLGAGISATDLIPFMTKSGVSPDTGPPSKDGILPVIARVFCFRHER